MKEGLDSRGGARAERVRRRGSRVSVFGGEFREMAELLRDGGPRKREGGGARLGCAVEDGVRVAMMSCDFLDAIAFVLSSSFNVS